MKKDVFQKIEILTHKASEVKGKGADEQAKTNINTVNSLADNIKSKEQADAFKKMLSLL